MEARAGNLELVARASLQAESRSLNTVDGVALQVTLTEERVCCSLGDNVHVDQSARGVGLHAHAATADAGMRAVSKITSERGNSGVVEAALKRIAACSTCSSSRIVCSACGHASSLVGKVSGSASANHLVAVSIAERSADSRSAIKASVRAVCQRIRRGSRCNAEMIRTALQRVARSSSESAGSSGRNSRAERKALIDIRVLNRSTSAHATDLAAIILAVRTAHAATEITSMRAVNRSSSAAGLRNAQVISAARKRVDCSVRKIALNPERASELARIHISKLARASGGHACAECVASGKINASRACVD